MALTTPVLTDGLRRIAAHMETVADELNALDGQLGDGDLGVTMTRGGRASAGHPADAARRMSAWR